MDHSWKIFVVQTIDSFVVDSTVLLPLLVSVLVSWPAHKEQLQARPHQSFHDDHHTATAADEASGYWVNSVEQWLEDMVFAETFPRWWRKRGARLAAAAVRTLHDCCLALGRCLLPSPQILRYLLAMEPWQFSLFAQIEQGEL